MGNLEAALGAAFDSESQTASPAAEPVAPETQETSTETPAQTPEAETAPAVPETPAPKPAEPQEETGDVLLDKLTPEQIAAVKADPKLRAIYKGLMSSYTPKMQQLAEQQRLWDALNNPETRKQAIEALARVEGLEFKPTDQPQRDQAAAVADNISDEWSKVVGPEAAAMLRPLIEKTALAAVNGTLQPLQKATEFLQLDAQSRQAEAQVAQFRSLAQEKGWDLTPEVEARMAQLGQQLLPATPIRTVQEGVKHLERLYNAANADGLEARIEKRILERMNKAAQSAEPARGVPSTGREKRTNVTKDMSLQQALDQAMDEALSASGLR